MGVIGCGRIAHHHVGGYGADERFHIVALADVHAAAMDEMDTAFGLSTNHYVDAEQMLAAEGLDVVSVCTWHADHAPWTIAAARHRPRVILCEKPMAEDLGHASNMRDVCARFGVRLAIAHQRRFLPAFTLARQLIADGAIGGVDLIVCCSGHGLPNWSTHLTDMFRYLLGDDECEWVMGGIERKTDRFERSTRIEDAALSVFQFRAGARALLLSDLTSHMYQGATIYGSDGMINLTTDSVQLLNGESKGRWQLHEPDGVHRARAEHPDDFEMAESSAGQAVELADWATGRAESHRGEAGNGYRALEMVMAVYESARRHERVVLPLQTLVNPLDVMVESGQLPPESPGRYDIRAFLARDPRGRDAEGTE